MCVCVLCVRALCVCVCVCECVCVCISWLGLVNVDYCCYTSSQWHPNWKPSNFHMILNCSVISDWLMSPKLNEPITIRALPCKALPYSFSSIVWADCFKMKCKLACHESLRLMIECLSSVVRRVTCISAHSVVIVHFLTFCSLYLFCVLPPQSVYRRTHARPRTLTRFSRRSRRLWPLSTASCSTWTHAATSLIASPLSIHTFSRAESPSVTLNFDLETPAAVRPPICIGYYCPVANQVNRFFSFSTYISGANNFLQTACF